MLGFYNCRACADGIRTRNLCSVEPVLPLNYRAKHRAILLPGRAWNAIHDAGTAIP